MVTINTIIRVMGQLGVGLTIFIQIWRAVLIVILAMIMFVEQEVMEVVHVSTIFAAQCIQH
jgi:hypothetical protein